MYNSGGACMKKTVSLFMFFVLIITFAFYGCGNAEKGAINSSSTAEEVVDFYANAVKNSKNKGDFSLDVTTSITLESIDSSANILKDVLESIIGYKVGDSRQSTLSYNFSGAADISDSSKTPLSVIQPAGAFIESFDKNAVTVKTVEGSKDISFSFEIAKESADLDTVMAAIRPILKEQEPADKTAIFNLAPNHSAFIDVGDILSTAIDILGISSLINMGGNDNSESTASDSSFGQTLSINDGICSIRNMEICALVDENNLLQFISINAPVELNADINFMGNNINTTICVNVIQRYIFSEHK